MPLINTSVPNLIQGVSQQSDNVKFAGQCDEQENALSSIVEGLSKRPATKHVRRLLTTAIGENSYFHFFNRDDDEKFVFIHDGTKLRVFNLLTGAEGLIRHDDGTGSTNYLQGFPVAQTYLASSDPKADMKALSVGDTTFLTNSSTTVLADSTKTADVKGEALVFIKQGGFEKLYEVDFGTTSDQAEIQYTTFYNYYDDSGS